MPAVLEDQAVAKKAPHGGLRPGAGRPKGQRTDTTVKIERSLVARARFVAECRGVTLVAYLTSACKPVIDRDFANESRRQGIEEDTA